MHLPVYTHVHTHIRTHYIHMDSEKLTDMAEDVCRIDHAS